MNIIENIKEFSKVFKLEDTKIVSKELESYKLITSIIPGEIREITEQYENLKIEGSIGKGNKTAYPWIGIFNNLVSTGATNGFYIVMLFSDDFNDLYLTLNQGSTQQSLKQIEGYRNYVYSKFNKIEGFNKGRLPEKSLVKLKEYNSTNIGRKYEETNIFYRHYNIDSIIEEDFIEHLKKIIEIYIKCANDYSEATIEKKNENEEFNSNTFYEDLVKANLKYEKSFIDRFIASLLTKPFVLLTGLSGSGKTKLAQAFVKWLCKDESQYAIISVGANWTNRDPLLGYINALDTNNYIHPENDCLKILINATKPENQDKPYFLILDEMNLSHVERYFSDFLSSMESGEDIKLHSTNNNEVPQKINISKNVFIIGTVNIDETTYMFSPKVLDRANVLEFKVTNDMMKEFLENPVKIDMQDIYSKGFLMNNDYMKKYLKTYNDFENKEFIVNGLLNFFNELKDLGAEYGFRTATEIFRFIAILREITPDIEVEKCIDYAIVQKLLPKVHGSRKRLQPILKKLGELCLMDNSSFEEYLSGKIELENIKYPVSLEKINRMYSRLLNDGFTSFAEA